ncbi:mamu class II histocompatibility antigen, DR alpha chain [Bombina bombina]|uniref:mamu class II histocompatibility antigen, DR alpha chain n=1 Tax=Bombina bombina TaxID=8345 RepID=UPI00235A8A7E|nr:mamu class II histocompatibility antigen, DR alpha chain [Bombina bombina]
MAERTHNHLRLHSLLCLFCVTQAVKVENILTEADYVQTQEPTGEFMFQFDGDEIFHVNLDKKETIWRLPQFGQVASFDALGALQNIAILKFNLDIAMKRSNHTAATNEPPEISIYAETPIVLGEPNTLICATDKFFPPIIKMTWLKNGQPVTNAVSETDYYPLQDGSYSKFLYLAFIPTKDDIYICSVEHAGLQTIPTNKIWVTEVPSHESEAVENMICGLGLAVGIIGIIAGMVLIIKGIKNNKSRGRGH